MLSPASVFDNSKIQQKNAKLATNHKSIFKSFEMRLFVAIKSLELL